MNELAEICGFLGEKTPEAWLQNALENLELLLIDHAHCEKKAASSALSLIYRYSDRPDLLQKMSRLAREELRHFEQVLAILQKRHISFRAIQASRYADGLRQFIRTHEPFRLIDNLIVGAFIEARSCERFALLYPHLEVDLSQFYFRLLSSEARHYQTYLALAKAIAGDDLTDRIAAFRRVENHLIRSPDNPFRFHSGPVVKENVSSVGA